MSSKFPAYILSWVLLLCCYPFLAIERQIVQTHNRRLADLNKDEIFCIVFCMSETITSTEKLRKKKSISTENGKLRTQRNSNGFSLIIRTIYLLLVLFHSLVVLEMSLYAEMHTPQSLFIQITRTTWLRKECVHLMQLIATTVALKIVENDCDEHNTSKCLSKYACVEKHIRCCCACIREHEIWSVVMFLSFLVLLLVLALWFVCIA